MLPKAHKTVSVVIESEGNALELRGPEARGFVRLLREGPGKGASEVGRVSIKHEGGEDSFPLHKDGSLRLSSGSAHALLALPAWLEEIRKGKQPTWPPKNQLSS